MRPFQWKNFDIGVNYTYIIDLTLPLNTIWKKFDKKCRNKIRSAEKHNLFLKETNDTKTLCSKIEDRYHQQGLNFPFFGSDYLDDIVTSFPQNVTIVSVCKDENIIDFAANYTYNNRIVLWMGGIVTEKTIHSNEYSIGEFIKNAKSEGLKILEIQGADTQRLCSFKTKFNPSIEASFSVKKKDIVGRISEFLYLNYMKRVWILFIVILQYFFTDASLLYSCSAC
jgi:lipid II:glycine glycyltransferase (peptidoglycan interpeptide bridge formation enzyme)